ncbi:MAG: hypothetical protein J6R99_00745 [Alphaproteobacteria bacterium]|nr:hypothetical protein [Alphaproteobacteria bacterium]
MTEIWVVIIASIVAPTFMKLLEWVFSKRKTEMRLSRIEILMNIAHNPEDEETILHLFDEYKKKGFNSYVEKRVKQYLKEREYGNQ